MLIKIRTTESLRNLRIFCPLLGTVHYWGLLLNKNSWEAGFCPLLGAFPLLGSALLGEYSVNMILDISTRYERLMMNFSFLIKDDDTHFWITMKYRLISNLLGSWPKSSPPICDRPPS